MTALQSILNYSRYMKHIHETNVSLLATKYFPLLFEPPGDFLKYFASHLFWLKYYIFCPVVQATFTVDQISRNSFITRRLSLRIESNRLHHSNESDIKSLRIAQESG